MGKRSALKAVVMGIIPLLNAYLFYCWCNEVKVKWKVAWLNSTLYALLFFLPVVQIYPLFKLFSIVDGKLGKDSKPAYGVKPMLLAASFAILPLMPLIWIYAVYRTQMLFNDNGVATL